RVVDRSTVMAKRKNDDPAQRRYGITTKLLSYLSAAWCGFCLLIISLLVTFSAFYLLSEALGRISIRNPGDFVGTLVGSIGPFCLLVLIFGVASGRFLLRALPPAMSDQGGRGRSGAVVLYAVAFVSLYMFGALGFPFLAATDKGAALVGIVLFGPF